MTVKLLGSSDAIGGDTFVTAAVDQIALTAPLGEDSLPGLCEIERAASVDLVVSYAPHCVRDQSQAPDSLASAAQLRRLAAIRARPGIGFPAAVHLERCAAPARVVVTDSPSMAMLGGIGSLVLVAEPHQLVDAIASGHFRIPTPKVLQVSLSGRLCPSVSARDVVLELLRLGLSERVRELAHPDSCPVILEFSGPGMRSMAVSERALLCSAAQQVGAAAALAACDERTDNFLRDQRRSKAYRQLAPDPGAPCSDALCLDLMTVVPMVALGNGQIVPASETAAMPIREVVIGGEATATLRDLLNAAVWFKTKRICPDVDVVLVPSSHQVFETIAADGTLAQLLSVGARLLEADSRLSTGEWQPPPPDGLSLRSYFCQQASGQFPNWAVASLDTLCMSAIAGTIQDPRAARKIPKVSLPRELPIDDSILFDKKPTVVTTMLPPPRSSCPAPPLEAGTEESKSRVQDPHCGTTELHLDGPPG
ncbi:MAG: aconitase family protein [Myxococcales bacterium]